MATPGYYSRDKYCIARYDGAGRLFLNERVPFTYRELADNRIHVSTEIDTLDSLAAKYFAPLQANTSLIDPCELWWIIADFQPPVDPDEDVSPQPDWCYDPTLAIPPNATIYIPSVRTVFEQIFNESRRAEHEE